MHSIKSIFLQDFLILLSSDYSISELKPENDTKQNKTLLQETSKKKQQQKLWRNFIVHFQRYLMRFDWNDVCA